MLTEFFQIIDNAVWSLYWLSKESQHSNFPLFGTTGSTFTSFFYDPAPELDTPRMVLKLALGIAFLIAIRGGVPRYRYDFLTKLGWVKFLIYIVTMFFLTLLLGTML